MDIKVLLYQFLISLVFLLYIEHHWIRYQTQERLRAALMSVNICTCNFSMRIDKLSCSHHRTILSRRCWSIVRSVGWSVVRLRYCNVVDALNIVLLAGNDCITMNNGTWDFSGRALWQSGCCITVSQRRGTRREQQTVNATNVQPLSLFLSVGPSFFLCLSFFLRLPLSRSRSCSRSRATILLEIISNLW